MADEYSFDDLPDEGELDLPSASFYPGMANTAAITGPIAEGGIRGISAIPDLGVMGFNALRRNTTPASLSVTSPGLAMASMLAEAIMGKKDIPTIGDTAAELAYPAEMKARVKAEASPWARATGDVLGTGEEFVSSLGPFGKIKSGATWLANNMPAAKMLALGLTAGLTGEGAYQATGEEKSRDIAKLIVAGVPAVAQAARLATRIPKVGPFLREQLVDKPLSWFAGLKEGNGEVQRLIKGTPEALAKEQIARADNALGGTPTDIEGARFRLMHEANDVAGTPETKLALSALPEMEARTLEGELAAKMTKNSTDYATGKKAITELEKVQKAEATAVDEMFNNLDLEAPYTPGDTEKKALKQIAKDIRLAARSNVNREVGLSSRAPAILRNLASGKGIYGKKAATLGDIKTLKQSLEDLATNVDASHQNTVKDALKRVRQLAPKEMQDAWSAYKSQMSAYDPSRLSGKILEAVEGQTKNARVPTSGKLLKNSPEKVTELIRGAGVEDFTDVASNIGNSKARLVFRKALASDLNRDLADVAKGAPKGVGEGAIKRVLQRFEDRKDLYRQVYGSDYDLIVERVKKAKTIQDARDVAHTLDALHFQPLKGLRIPMQDTGVRFGDPTHLFPVYGYGKPQKVFQWLYGDKEREANRLMYNALSGKYGLPQVNKSAITSAGEIAGNLSRKAPEAAQLLSRIMGSTEDIPAPTIPQEDFFDLPDESKKKGDEMSSLLGYDQDKLLDAVKKVETGGIKDPQKAVSKAGARGPFQFMPKMAKAFGVNLDDGSEVDDRQGAAALLGDEFKALKDPKLAIAAYNAGRPKVLKAIEQAGSRDWEEVKKFLPAETQAYVPAVLKNIG